MKGKTYSRIVLGGTVAVLVCVVLFMIIVDPMFNYHKPFNGLTYVLNNERYQNAGIYRNFEYNAVITGTSMTENFLASEFDELFQVQSVKVPFYGATYKEIDSQLRLGFENNDNIKIVLRGLDLGHLIEDKDEMKYGGRPTFLYNNTILDDAPYLLNKMRVEEAVNNVILTYKGVESTSFDEYAVWRGKKYGKEAVFETWNNAPRVLCPVTQNCENIVKNNVTQNILETVQNNPDTMFYLFWTPHSVVYWDKLQKEGNTDLMINSLILATEMLLEEDNVKIFSFFDNYNLICNLENYKDILHYGEWINSDILKWMNNDEYLLTKDNYKEHFEEIRLFYSNYNYSQFYN